MSGRATITSALAILAALAGTAMVVAASAPAHSQSVNDTSSAPGIPLESGTAGADSRATYVPRVLNGGYLYSVHGQRTRRGGKSRRSGWIVQRSLADGRERIVFRDKRHYVVGLCAASAHLLVGVRGTGSNAAVYRIDLLTGDRTLLASGTGRNGNNAGELPAPSYLAPNGDAVVEHDWIVRSDGTVPAFALFTVHRIDGSVQRVELDSEERLYLPPRAQLFGSKLLLEGDPVYSGSVGTTVIDLTTGGRAKFMAGGARSLIAADGALLSTLVFQGKWQGIVRFQTTPDAPEPIVPPAIAQTRWPSSTLHECDGDVLLLTFEDSNFESFFTGPYEFGTYWSRYSALSQRGRTIISVLTPNGATLMQFPARDFGAIDAIACRNGAVEIASRNNRDKLKLRVLAYR